MEKDVFIFPCYVAQGGSALEAVSVARAKEIAWTFGDRIIPIPLVNGPGDLKTAASKVAAGLYPLVVSREETQGRGLVGVLISGYRHVLENYPDRTVVRADPDHSLAQVKIVYAAARSRGKMIVGDRDYKERTDLMSPYDYEVHTKLFPKLYGEATDGAVKLSCAHGLQAFGPQVSMQKMLDLAMYVIYRVEQSIGGPMKWGFDGLMALAAWRLGVSVEVIKFPAVEPRFRKDEKAQEQLENHRAMIAAWKKVLP